MYVCCKYNSIHISYAYSCLIYTPGMPAVFCYSAQIGTFALEVSIVQSSQLTGARSTKVF